MKRIPRLAHWLQMGAAAAIVACALYYLSAFLYVALSRLHYPFSLDWAEGDSLIQVHRLLTGEPLYDKPSYTYLALVYPPLYFYLSALVARLVGFGFFPLRLVSLLSSLGCMGAIFLTCRREGAGLVPAIAASGFFAAAFPLTGYWFDIGRVDMLAAFLVLLSILLLTSRTILADALAGLALALACLTKQTNLLLLLILGLYFVVFARRRLPAFMIPSLAALAVATLVLDRIYSGWFSFYAIHLPLGSGSTPSLTVSSVVESIPTFWWSALIAAVPVVILVVMAYAYIIVRDRQELPQLLFYLFTAAALFGISWASIAHAGSFKNDLVPAYSILAILLGLGLQRLARDLPPDALRRPLLLGACLLQFALLYTSTGSQIPTAADLQAGQELLARIASQPADVYVPFHPELPLMAGKWPYASLDTAYQLEGGYGGGDIAATQRVKVEFNNAMARQQFSMILLDRDLNWVWGHPEKYYSISDQPVFADPNVFWPVTGWRNRPTYQMFPIRH